MSSRKYEVVVGFFVQDEGHLDSSHPVLKRFGLLDSSELRWTNTIDKLKKLNATAEKGVSYKLIFAGRHGQGYHNVAESKYGPSWEGQMAKLNGDDEITWGPDPLLTSIGEGQARDACAMWKEEREAGIPLPDGIYCSPMTRALQTCQITFNNILSLSQKRPLILENVREIYGIHTCDHRRSLSYIRSTFPEFKVEEGFKEEDELFDPEVRELRSHTAKRAHSVLDYVFENDGGIFISIISHSGFIRGLCAATGHNLSKITDDEFSVAFPTGGVLPILVKSTSIAAGHQA